MPFSLRQLRTLLMLGRVSNLPTVWSNCLAAWVLNGGFSWLDLFVLGCSATLLYSGGMFLNDAFDAEFDRQHRRERPIPSGQISARSVWVLGAASLASGWALILLLGTSAALMALLLVLAIVVYDAIHKRTVLAPLLMGACRFLLYLVAASATRRPVGDAVFWHALALAAYVSGLSFLARGESTSSPIRRWPLLLLAAPIVACLWVTLSRSLVSWLAMICLITWVVLRLRELFRRGESNTGNTVAGLLAGIVLVDWAAIVQPSVELSLLFVGLFALALIFQRTFPAT